MIKEQDDVHKTATQSIDRNFKQHGQAAEVKNNPKGGTKVTPKKTAPSAPGGATTKSFADWKAQQNKPQ